MDRESLRKPSFHLASTLDDASMTSLHWVIWGLSAMGIFLDGLDLFVIGISMPLIQKTMGLNAVMTGLIGSAAVIGAILGAVIGGRLTDRWGRKAIYIADLIVFIVFALFSAFAWDPVSLFVFRFLLGVGVGADYPICASYVSEFMPSRSRGRMLVSAFAFQALGVFAAALGGLAILKLFPEQTSWRYIIGIGVIPAILILICRTKVPESARWLLEHGRVNEAASIIGRLVPGRKDWVEEQRARIPHAEAAAVSKRNDYSALFRSPFMKRTFLGTVPWFLMDIAAYGVGLFTPIIIGAIAVTGGGIDFLSKDLLATEESALVDIFLVIGFILNILLVERWGRMRLQIIGFGGMTLGLVILALAASRQAEVWYIFGGFIVFNVMMNMGPNATTFLLPAELFPTNLRASAHGFSAGIAKAGAAIGIFFLPILSERFGVPATMSIIAVITAVGLMITAICRIETSQRSLEELNPADLR